MQAVLRGRLLTYKYQFMRKRIARLQAHCRGFLIRRQTQRYLGGVVRVQAYFRMVLARRQFRKQIVDVSYGLFNLGGISVGLLINFSLG